jgi:NADH:ubiquinone oxidoreductase subunit 5 (subunit L)/multisubunit Na+/H+ antiporter MnhA subunit
MYVTILFLPLLAFLYSASFGKYFGRKASTFLPAVFVVAAFLVSVLAFYEIVLSGTVVKIKLFS